MCWANEPKRALNWGGCAVRVSPFDPLIYAAYRGLAVGYFASGRYGTAVSEARRSVRANAGFSMGHFGAGCVASLQWVSSRKASSQPLKFAPRPEFRRRGEPSAADRRARRSRSTVRRSLPRDWIAVINRSTGAIHPWSSIVEPHGRTGAGMAETTPDATSSLQVSSPRGMQLPPVTAMGFGLVCP
jgi:hypothetical protein